MYQVKKPCKFCGVVLNSTQRRSHHCSEKLFFIHADGSKACLAWPPKDLAGRTLEEYSLALIAVYARREIPQRLVSAEVVSPFGKILQRWDNPAEPIGEANAARASREDQHQNWQHHFAVR